MFQADAVHVERGLHEAASRSPPSFSVWTYCFFSSPTGLRVLTERHVQLSPYLRRSRKAREGRLRQGIWYVRYKRNFSVFSSHSSFFASCFVRAGEVDAIETCYWMHWCLIVLYTCVCQVVQCWYPPPFSLLFWNWLCRLPKGQAQLEDKDWVWSGELVGWGWALAPTYPFLSLSPSLLSLLIFLSSSLPPLPSLSYPGIWYEWLTRSWKEQNHRTAENQAKVSRLW